MSEQQREDGQGERIKEEDTLAERSALSVPPVGSRACLISELTVAYLKDGNGQDVITGGVVRVGLIRP
ncbi:hypothetical protein P3W43_01485 [Salinicola salarius]|uniref:hypothetical protein n=1 Tax=Salinicola salarius TaxID=430457 RepID=UPI0023E3F414|nr:hypothetical protein [Salinicola salarius]MDF3917521.1 hypothetical protein [Salinicola salarius]